MKIEEMRSLSVDDLKAKTVILEENQLRLRCNKKVGQLENTASIMLGRKEIARAKTILSEKLREG